MKEYKYILLGALGFVGIITLWVLMFTTPFWWMWNRIISPKFELPTLTFSEAFWIILITKWLFSISEIEKRTKNHLDKK